MRLVQSFNEIIANTQILDSYLIKKHEPEYFYTLSLIKNGAE